MLEAADRSRAPERSRRSWLLACALALLVAQPAFALCEVIDFSAVKQRTRGTIDGALVSTLVATPAAAPGDAVLLEADFGCMVGTGFDPLPANNEVRVAVLKSSGGAFENRSLPGSFESFFVPSGSIEVLDCVGQACGTLRFVMPASGFAGPAEITVTRAGEVVARIFELGARTAACLNDAPDGLFGTFTLLPAYNPLQVSPAGAANPDLEAAIAGNGSLMLPIEFPLVGQAAVDASATRATGPEITKIPDQRFLRSLSHLFRPLPAIHRLVDPQGPNAALYSTADVPRGTIQILQVADPGGPNETPYPDNFHALRASDAGPVVLPTAVTIRFEGVSPVVALRSSPETVALGISEELLGDLNADTDASDLLLSATDLASGITTDTGQAIALVAASPARPAVTVSGGVVAFLESEALSGYTDLNGDNAVNDLVTRVLENALPVDPGPSANTSTDAARAVDGAALAVSQGVVYFRTPEPATAPQFTTRVSDIAGMGGDDASQGASIDGAGARVAYATRAGNLVDGATGEHQQIVVTDLDGGAHALVSESGGVAGNADSFDAAIGAGGYHVAFASRATNLAPLGGGSGSTPVVWERGVGVLGENIGSFSFSIFHFGVGADDAPGVDYSNCTAEHPGLAISFAASTVEGFLVAGDDSCSFFAEFAGSYTLSGPVAVGTEITIDAPLTTVEATPALDPSLVNRRLFAVVTITDVDAPGVFEFAGDFELRADTSIANTVTQVYARALGGGSPVELVSAAQGGGGGDAASGEPAPSGDGELVAFTSEASDLVASDTNGASDVFVRDLVSDATERASVTSAEAQANGASSAPATTPDGLLVAFASNATNLATGDTNGASDVFVRDRSAGTTVRVSLAAPGGSVNGASGTPDLSDDGRFVVFESAARLVPADTDGFLDIYVRDRLEGTTERVSVASGGEPANNGSFAASISGDGRFVVFASAATNLVPGTPAGGANIFRRDRITGTVELLSQGASAGDLSDAPDASGDGATVAFDSDASLVLNDSLPVDVFVRETGMGAQLNADADASDTVLQAFATGVAPGLRPGARVAASAVVTGFGRALVRTPEVEEGNANLNATSLLPGVLADGDPDTDDGVLQLYDGNLDQRVNLGVAGPGGALSDTTLCALVDEAEQNGSDLNGKNGANDLVLVAGDIATLLATPTAESLTNVGIAATQVFVAGTVCVFTVPEAVEGDLNGDGPDDEVLMFYDLATGKLVNSGFAATRVQVGPTQELIGFRVPEARQGGLDLNLDLDANDEVMHAVALQAVLDAAPGSMIAAAVRNLGLQAIDCDLPGCETFRFGSILADGTISFLGTEPGETIDRFDCLSTSTSFCDFNGDVDGNDTVVHLVKATLMGAAPPTVKLVGSLALSTVALQQTSVLPELGPQGTSLTIQITECEAARTACPDTRSHQAPNGVIGPPLSDCAARLDVDDDGVLECSTERRYLAIDSDADGVLDLFDNAPFDFNPDQEDVDGDGVGDVIDNDPNSVLACELDCDLNEDGSKDQADVDAILAAAAAGEVVETECNDRRDRDGNLRITFADASLCKAACDRPDCSPPPVAPFSGGGPAACGIGVELVVVLPLLLAARRRRGAG
jgi:hypothetical protein